MKYDFIIVKCNCQHLGVPKGIEGTVKLKDIGEYAIVKWDNGITESIQWDMVDILKS